MADPRQKDRILRLGRAGQFLRDSGIADAEVVLDYDKLVRKSKESYNNNHPFDTQDIKDLPKAINTPIAVFDNTNDADRGKVILTELKKDGRNFIVAVQTKELRRKGGVILEVNDIATLFPKDARGIINWFNTGKATNINTKKALDFIEALPNHPGTSTKAEELSSAAKVVKEFENPALPGGEKIGRGKNLADRGVADIYREGGEDGSASAAKAEAAAPVAKRSAAEHLSGQLHTPLRIVEDVSEITHADAKVQRRRRGAKGWYDTRTGEVVIVLPNNADAADVASTVMHETVAHKGLRELVGEERYGEFLDGVHDHLTDDLKKEVDERANRAFLHDVEDNGGAARSRAVAYLPRLLLLSINLSRAKAVILR